MRKLLIYKCNECGYILEVIHLGKRTLVSAGEGYTKTLTVADAKVICCGKPMQLLTANTVDASTEKHVPDIKFEGDKVVVNVGSVDHPMTPEHLIQWVILCYDNVVQRVDLTADDKPHAEFFIGPDVKLVEAYAYCNLHGLWSATATR